MGRLKSAMNTCLGVFGLKLTSFNPSQPGRSGDAVVNLIDPNGKIPGTNFNGFGVVNNVETYTLAQIKGLWNQDWAAFEASGLHTVGNKNGGQVKMIFDAHTNYTATDLPNSTRRQVSGLTGLSALIGNILQAQIHELGNSVADITRHPIGQPKPKGWKGNWDSDSGHQIEICVKNNYTGAK